MNQNETLVIHKVTGDRFYRELYIVASEANYELIALGQFNEVLKEKYPKDIKGAVNATQRIHELKELSQSSLF